MSEGHGARNGARLRLARQARGLSQQQVASMAGVSRQAVSAVESGVNDPSLRAAQALARALGMTVEELFGADDTVMSVAAVPWMRQGPGGSIVNVSSVAGSIQVGSCIPYACSKAATQNVGQNYYVAKDQDCLGQAYELMGKKAEAEHDFARSIALSSIRGKCTVVAG